MKVIKDWKCQECGRKMTLKAAERAVNGTNGCAGCGGVDIDLDVIGPDTTSEKRGER